MSLSNIATKVITGANGFFDFGFQISGCQQGLKRARPTATTASA